MILLRFIGANLRNLRMKISSDEKSLSYSELKT